MNAQTEGISMKSLFEEMGETYILGADGMYYPDLAFFCFAIAY